MILKSIYTLQISETHHSVCCKSLRTLQTSQVTVFSNRNPKKNKIFPGDHSVTETCDRVDHSLTQSLETKLAKAFSGDNSLVHVGVGRRDVGHLGRERIGRQTLNVSHPGFTKERITKVSAAGARRKWNITSKGAERHSRGWHLMWRVFFFFFLIQRTNIRTLSPAAHMWACYPRGLHRGFAPGHTRVMCIVWHIRMFE